MARPQSPTCSTALACTALLLTTLAASGCVKRTLLIESDPPGALVFLNDEEEGRTPVTVHFKWYGTYDVRLEMDGYQTLHAHQELEQPWWEHPGPDLFAEAIPNRRVERNWSFVLEPAQHPNDVDTDALLDRAERMREDNLLPSE